jgi:hypothetical protein
MRRSRALRKIRVQWATMGGTDSVGIRGQSGQTESAPSPAGIEVLWLMAYPEKIARDSLLTNGFNLLAWPVSSSETH